MAMFKFTQDFGLNEIVDKISYTTQLFIDNTTKFCEQALKDNIGDENVAKLRKLGGKLYNALSSFEKELRNEYSKQIKDTFQDGKETSSLLCTGILELIQATTYMKSAIDKAMVVLDNNESLDNNKRLKKEIFNDLKNAAQHVKTGVSSLYEGFSLGVKTANKIRNISSNMSVVFSAFNNAASIFMATTPEENKIYKKHKH